MIIGSNYIYVEFITGINYKSNLPNYVIENLSPEEISSSNYRLPKYIMIKFRAKESNIDQSYNILKIALNGKEWKVIKTLLKKNSFRILIKKKNLK